MKDPIDWQIGDFVFNKKTEQTVLVDFPLAIHFAKKALHYRPDGYVEREIYERARINFNWLRPATHESLATIVENRRLFGFEG